MTRPLLAPCEHKGGAMSPATSTRELAARESDRGQIVAVVDWEDARVGDCFELAVTPERALDAFHHPFAYAA